MAALLFLQKGRPWTGRATIHFEPRKGKAVTKALRLKPSVELLDDSFGSGAGSVAVFGKYAGC